MNACDIKISMTLQELDSLLRDAGASDSFIAKTLSPHFLENLKSTAPRAKGDFSARLDDALEKRYGLKPEATQ